MSILGCLSVDRFPASGKIAPDVLAFSNKLFRTLLGAVPQLDAGKATGEITSDQERARVIGFT